MAWDALIEIIKAEADGAAFTRIERRLRLELGGLRLSVPTRPFVSRAEAHKAVRQANGNVDKAAKDVGLSKSSMYRRLRAPSRQDPGPRMGGRMVR